MQKKLNWSKVSAIGLGVLLVIGGSMGAVSLNNQHNQLDEIEASIAELGNEEVVEEPEVITTQLDDVQTEVEAIKLKMFEDDAWEAEAELIATDEFEENDNKDVYNALNDIFVGTDDEIDDRDEIEYIREDEGTDFNGMDADDKDGTITQYIKVKYENKVGDDVKKYLTITTDIEEGEIEDQDIVETS